MRTESTNFDMRRMQHILTEIKHVRSAQKSAHRGAGKALRACEAKIQTPKNIQRNFKFRIMITSKLKPNSI
jgi:hypothetical protein